VDGTTFVLTAYLLLITEAIGTYVGVHFLWVVPGRLERLERIPDGELFWDDSAKEQLLWQTSEPSLNHGGLTFSSLCRSSPTSCFAANTHGLQAIRFSPAQSSRSRLALLKAQSRSISGLHLASCPDMLARSPI
jgi:hypothetical protein